MKNYAVRGMALNDAIRILGVNTTELIESANKQLKTTPNAIAALGRTMSITLLMGLMRKNDEQISIVINGDGELRKIHVQYLGKGIVRGYVDNPNVPLYINDKNKLDVKRVVGTNGSLQVSIKQGLKSDYHSSVPLVSGEISEDFTYYFANSEQTPSVVSAGVLVNKDNSVISSGALIIQLMPNATEQDIIEVEKRLDKVSNLSNTLLVNPSIEVLIHDLFEDFNLLDKQPISYECSCSTEDMQAKISTISNEELLMIKKEDGGIEAVCHWCNTKYWYDEDGIDQIINDKL